MSQLDDIFEPLREHIALLEDENKTLRRQLDAAIHEVGGAKPKQASIPLQMSLMLEAFNQRLVSLSIETANRAEQLETRIVDYINDLARLTKRVDTIMDHFNEKTLSQGYEWSDEDDEE